MAQCRRPLFELEVLDIWARRNYLNEKAVASCVDSRNTLHARASAVTANELRAGGGLLKGGTYLDLGVVAGF